MKTTKWITRADDVKKGDIVWFTQYSLRVEAEPQYSHGWVALHGRTNIGGCPLVTKRFMVGTLMTVERTA